MTNKVFPAWMLAIALCLTGAVQASPVTADEEAVAQTLRQMYVRLDQRGHRSATSRDHYLLQCVRRGSAVNLASTHRSVQNGLNYTRMRDLGAEWVGACIQRHESGSSILGEKIPSSRQEVSPCFRAGPEMR
jgi:hypothetical protein